MMQGLKELFIVLVLAIPLFKIARPFCLQFTEAATYDRRRNIWLTLTAVAFLSPNFWLYAMVAAPLMYWGAKKDDAPMALYLLLAMVIPPVSVQVPTIGIGQLLPMDQARMMALVILIPLATRRPADKGLSTSRRLTLMDGMLLGYCLLDLALQVPYESTTTTLRRGSILFLDTFILFYMFARIRPTARALQDLIATFTLSIAIVCAVAIFEFMRGWLIYVPIPARWGSPNVFAFLLRDSELRAQSATGHSLALGYIGAIGLGLWYWLSQFESRRWVKIAGALLLAGGTFASYSRGGWLTAVLACVLYASFRPGSAKYLAKAVPIAVLAVALAYNTPLKEKIFDKLPFIGKTEQGNVDYRQELFDVSWRLIKINPWFGDPFVARNMQELRQGQGIIDIVNGFLKIALFDGIVGAVLFYSVHVLALWRAGKAMRLFGTTNAPMASMGAALLATMLGTLFFIATAGSGPTDFILAGMMATYAGCAVAERQTSPRTATFAAA